MKKVVNLRYSSHGSAKILLSMIFKEGLFMNCYVHTDKEAVGTCVGCGKFICAECLTEI